MKIQRKIDWILVAAIATALLPIVLPMAGFTLANACGCRVHEGDIVPCHVLGFDIGPLLYTMITAWPCTCCLTPIAGLVALLRALMVYVGPG